MTTTDEIHEMQFESLLISICSMHAVKGCVRVRDKNTHILVFANGQLNILKSQSNGMYFKSMKSIV